MIIHSEIKAPTSYIADFMQNGVCVFKNKIDAKRIELLIAETNKIKETVMAKVITMDRPLKNYSDIAERHLGRLDYRCGFTSEIFDVVAKDITNIITDISPHIDFRYYWGIITSLGGSGPTNWHRDIYPILNTTEGVNLGVHDLSLPPYYFTVLVPLVKITPENGPTAFIKGSNNKLIVNESNEEIYAPLLSPGDITIFDGRTLHKGLSNNTNEERLIAYITFTANWYHDQTFTQNDYLFPELLAKSK